MKKTVHIPVMMQEAVEFLSLKSGMTVVDATLGGGGYAREIYQQIGESGQLIVFDRDAEAIDRFKNNYSEIAKNIICVHSNYGDIKKVLAENNIKKVDAIVADLGLSSDQLNDLERGFSFKEDNLLDMRMDQSEEYSAINLVNDTDEEVLADMLYLYGDERMSRKVAKSIVEARPVESTAELVEIIEKVLPPRRGSKIHPATKTFQAIRIAVNREFEHLKIFLTDGIDLLKVGGRMAIVSFHSGEDKIVKNIFRTNARGCVCPEYVFKCECGHQALVKKITKKPLRPSSEEVKNNPRSRSACLRIVEKIDE